VVEICFIIDNAGCDSKGNSKMPMQRVLIVRVVMIKELLTRLAIIYQVSRITTSSFEKDAISAHNLKEQNSDLSFVSSIDCNASSAIESTKTFNTSGNNNSQHEDGEILAVSGLVNWNHMIVKEEGLFLLNDPIISPSTDEGMILIGASEIAEAAVSHKLNLVMFIDVFIPQARNKD
ncbi:hypothetical protein ACJX0J_037652, partial [Zea mays]